MKNINKLQLEINKHIYTAMAGVLVLAIVMTALPLAMGQASAGQLTSRYIQMEDSGPSGVISSGVGDGLQVDYKVGFTPSVTTAIGAVIIDFCSNSAIIGDSTCTAPVGFNTNFSTLTVSNQTAACGTNAFTVVTTGTGITVSTASRVVLSRTAQAPTIASCNFDLGLAANTGFTNPTTVGSFYARITTYAANPAAYTAGAPGAYIDAGAVALSTANVITITARVQESLIFCMSAAAPSANCGGTSLPAVTLGHGTTGKVIDSSAIDTGVVYSQLSTNAGAGAIIRIHSNASCGGLSADGGATCGIPSANAGAVTAPTAAMVAGTAGFGLTIAAGSGGTGTVSPIAPYANTTANYYGFDSTSTNNVTTTYGSSAAQSTAPVSNVNNTWTFAATAANTTPAGLYSANLAAIATGTF